jgi:hypothetical protein
MEGIIELPGGFRVGESFVREVEFREMSGAEEEILLDQRKSEGKGKSLKSMSQRLTEILARCTVRIGEKYEELNRQPEKALAKPFLDLWASGLLGDRGVAIVRLRQLSLGDSFVFPETCPVCRREIQRVEYDLSEIDVDPYFKYIDNDLREQNPDASEEVLQTMAEEQRLRLFTQDEDFSVTLPKSGLECKYRLLTAKDEDRIATIPEKHGDNLVTALLSLRLLAIDGEPINGNLKHPKIKFLTLSDRDFLRQYFDQIEGGMDQKVSIQCDACNAQFWRRLDPTKPGFFHRLGA